MTSNSAPEACVDGVSVSFEPGSWTIPSLEALLQRATRSNDAGRRLKELATAFLGTPFLDESELAHPPAGTQRVRLQTFDCITYIYTMYALLGASTFTDFANALSGIRYTDRPEEENLIHYAWNSLMKIVERGLARDVTEELLEADRLRVRTVSLGIKGDGQPFLKHPRVGDRNIGESVTVRYVPTAEVRGVEPKLVDGDTVVFVSAWDPAEYPAIVGHSAIVHKENGDQRAFMLHSSKSRIGSQEGSRAGVIFLTEWDAERRALAAGGPLCPLHCYLGHHTERFDGIVVLRPQMP